ncbi:tRNA (adenosine(37)-N6)-dimethylallyltransferase MiaA [Ulvibacter antarcticus]|uniref:tRNA dimethylallyltransferase n=1 Tax=Ulvibacter antarcticus TaxID=442714 RepID=A0A3L9YWJ9_9FLAO|nr:tRNA (adenosine(37)-N6)-dimethylallyltransferase MiaA [Ulvibacter antarcticus]RMA64893.1 tRNA dimethylallyltransferase [Ulvibacter antarcticus]
MSVKKPLLICVVGPTAIGKTNLSIELAKAFNTEIISADSRQFFKEMRIGTAVPSSEELAMAPHHFIQNKSIFDSYSVGDFEKEALLKLENLFEKHRLVIMVGGSGMYVDAVVNGMDKFPEVASGVREQLNQELETLGLEALQKELKKVDPEYFQKADIQNPHRVIRALEIYRASGNSYSSFLAKKKPVRSFNTIYIGLTAERDVIYTRINKRVDLMIEEGLLEEAKLLFKHKDLNALQTVGYRELFRFFEGDLTKEEAIEEIKKNSRRFAKRQGTWYRKNEQIKWFDYSDSTSGVVDYIKEKNAL